MDAIRAELEALADEGYQAFQAKLVPNIDEARSFLQRPLPHPT